MALRSFLAGNSYTLTFNFFTSVGDRTSVSSPAISIFTPERTAYLSGITVGVVGVTGTEGEYTYTLPVTTAMTVGTWMAVATGISQSSSLFSGYVTFNVVNYLTEPVWLGLEDFREYIEEPDDVHTYDSLFNRLLLSSMRLVEQFTRPWGYYRASEVKYIRNADRMLLKAGYPINAITGLTVTESYTPASPGNLSAETSVGTTISFYYRLDKTTGTLVFTDVDGFDQYYQDIFIAVDVLMGDGAVPEPMRLLGLYWASKLLNLHQNEGLDAVRIGDINYALRRGLLDETAKDLLSHYQSINW